MKTLSLCMIVRDETKNLARSLAPLRPYVDEAVVVDTGSQDDTPAMAARYGARVFSFPWQDDFSAARNFSLARARGDWIFWLDADNRLEDSDARQLKALVQRPADAILWCTEVVEPDRGRLLQKRIFPRRADIRFRYRVHEQLVHPPEMENVLTPIEIFHWGYQDRETFRAKGQRNYAYLAKELQERPDDYYVHYQLARYHFFQGEVRQVQAHLEKVLTNPATPAENLELYQRAWLLKAQTYWRLGGKLLAFESLHGLLGQYPMYGLAWYYLGLWAFQEGRYQQAAHSLDLFLGLGSGHLLLDQPEEKLLLTALLARARALRKCQQYQEAGKMLAVAREHFPQHFSVWLEQAELACLTADRRRARSALEVCLRLRPDNRRAQALRRTLELSPCPVGRGM